MKNLIFKEFKLVLSPATFFFGICAVLVMIPNYPVYSSVIYLLASFFTTFLNAQANNDLLFTALLPVRRNDIVLGKHFLVILTEVLFMIATVPFAILAMLVISPNGNFVGLDANMAFYGITFISLAAYNLCLLPYYFKTGTRCGKGLLFGIIAALLIYGIFQTLVYIPNCPFYLIDSVDYANTFALGAQAITLAVGIVIYILSNILSYFISIKNFKKVSL